MTDSLSRSGEGGMLAPLRLTDGVQATPGLGFTNEPGSGLYRAGTNEWWSVAGGVQVQQHTSNGAVTRFAAGAVGTPSLSAFGDVNTGLWFPAADTIAASVGGVEGWRLNSFGLGVGGVPVNRFDVVGDQNSSLTSRVVNINAGGSAGSRLRLENASAPWDISNSRANSSALTFEYNSTEQMRLTSTGNLGIGTSSPGAKLQVSGSAKVGTGAASNSATFMVNNPNATATGIQLFQDSQESWVMGLLASSTALTWANSGAEKMRLDSSGNLGIGTSSPSARLHVASASAEAVIQDSDTAKGSNPTALLSLWGSDARAGYIGYPADSNMYITQVNNNAMLFLTNNTERARISAGGYSKFSNNGTYVSSTGAYHEFHSSDAAQPILYLTATSGSYTGQTIYINNTRAASSAYKFYSANANAVEQFYVRGDGVLYAQNTTIQSLSDGRLKENIRNATEGLDVINALRPIRYDWKTGFGNDRKNQLGFVAQEVEAVFPDAVSEWSKTEGDEEAYKTVGPGALIPVLVKAIQELTARVAQLESK